MINMSDKTDGVIAARSCSRCVYWKPDTGECRYGPPTACGDRGNWPTTAADDYCFRWKTGEGSVRVSSLSTETILSYLSDCGQILIPGTTEFEQRGWAVRSDLISTIAMEQPVTKAAVFSRIKTLVKYGILGMGKYPPGASSEQAVDCVWKMAVDQKSEEPEPYVEDVTPGRPKLFTCDIVVSFLQQNHWSPEKAIGLRPLHRAISLKNPMSLSTCKRLVEEAMKAEVIQRWEEGYWAPAQKTESIEVSE